MKFKIQCSSRSDSKYRATFSTVSLHRICILRRYNWLFLLLYFLSVTVRNSVKSSQQAVIESIHLF